MPTTYGVHYSRGREDTSRTVTPIDGPLRIADFMRRRRLTQPPSQRSCVSFPLPCRKGFDLQKPFGDQAATSTEFPCSRYDSTLPRLHHEHDPDRIRTGDLCLDRFSARTAIVPRGNTARLVALPIIRQPQLSHAYSSECKRKRKGSSYCNPSSCFMDRTSKSVPGCVSRSRASREPDSDRVFLRLPAFTAA